MQNKINQLANNIDNIAKFRTGQIWNNVMGSVTSVNPIKINTGSIILTKNNLYFLDPVFPFNGGYGYFDSSLVQDDLKKLKVGDSVLLSPVQSANAYVLLGVLT